MLRQLLKVALRRNVKDRMGLWFQLLGMTIGLTAVFLILLIVANDLAVDKHIKKLDQKYRVIVYDSTHHWNMGQSPYPLASTLVEESPLVKEATRVFDLGKISAGQSIHTRVDVSSAFCADSSFFELFSVPLITGDLSKKGVWIAQSLADKIFGSTPVADQMVHLSAQGVELSLPVVGVYEDITENASLSPEIIVPMERAFDLFHVYFSNSDPAFKERNHREDWNLLAFQTYILLHENVREADLASTLTQISTRHMAGESRFRFFTQPLEAMYLNSDAIQSNGFEAGNKQMMKILLVVCFFITLVILVNYLIQNTASWVVRTREIGMRKVLGAQFSHLFVQVLVESLVTFVIIFLLALIAVEQLRPVLGSVLNSSLTMNHQVWYWLFPGVMGVFAIMVMVPVFYVVIFLNRLPVQSIFMQQIKMKGFSGGFRTILLGVQYVVFILLLIGSIVIYMQLRWAKTKDMGYASKQLLMFALEDEGLRQHREIIKKELEQVGAIDHVSTAMWLPPTSNTLSVSAQHPENSEQKIQLEGLFVDGDFPMAMGLRPLPGYSLERFAGMSNGVIINESALKLLDMEDPTGEHLFMGPIVAVVEDFHVHTVHREIKPMVLVKMPDMSRQVVVHFQQERKAEAKQAIHAVIESIGPSSTVQVREVQEMLTQLHEEDYRLARSITAFAIVAMLIGCMGLLAITRFMLQRQQKELAIRKVHGATVGQLLSLVAKGYGAVIAGACMVGFPLSYVLVQWWLSRFAYAISFPWWLFGLAGVVIVVITSATLLHITLRTARLNPAFVLRNE
ncbi:MAG: ABC transporter permease [Bacteroidota bacterium]